MRSPVHPTSSDLSNGRRNQMKTVPDKDDVNNDFFSLSLRFFSSFPITCACLKNQIVFFSVSSPLDSLGIFSTLSSSSQLGRCLRLHLPQHVFSKICGRSIAYEYGFAPWGRLESPPVDEIVCCRQRGHSRQFAHSLVARRLSHKNSSFGIKALGIAGKTTVESPSVHQPNQHNSHEGVCSPLHRRPRFFSLR